MTKFEDSNTPDSYDLFWRYVSEDELRFQHCRQCGLWRNPPEDVCPECLSFEHRWEFITGRGEILTALTVNNDRSASIGNRDDTYSIVHAELYEGIRYTAILWTESGGIPPIGSHVQLIIGQDVFGKKAPEYRLAP